MRLRLPVFCGAALLALTALPAYAQKRDGLFVPAGGAGVPWSINAHHTLIWNGEPYLPVGIRIDGDATAVKAAAAAGIKDVIVDLPASGVGWAETLPALEAAKLRYLIRIGSLAPTAKGIAVEPQSYRLAGITKPRTISLDMPGATSAFAVLASRRDGSVSASGPVAIKQGRLEYAAKPGGEIEHVLLLYPETSSLEQPDLWEKFDSHRDTLLATLRRYPPGPGFRGLVNPLGRTFGLPGKELRIVPSSATFRMELRELIEKRYRSVVTAMRSWGIGPNSFTTFDELARLVPLWQGARGVGLLLDPTTNRTYSADMKRSTIWGDLSEAVNEASNRRFGRLTAAIRKVVDAPVIQEWAGWSGTYEASPAPVDGVGMRATGNSPSAIAQTGSRAASTVMRWSSTGWLPATEVDLGTGADAIGQLAGSLDDLVALGARGAFVRADDANMVKAVVAEATRRVGDVAIANSSPRPLFFPENATNPAVVQRLPGNGWWLPAPSDGNRIDLGSGFFAYRMRQPEVGNALALWARVPGRYRLRMTSTKGVEFQTIDGSDPKPKASKNGVEVTLTDYPVLILGTDEIPIPEVALLETAERFAALLKTADTEHRDVIEERIAFQQISQGFDRNPGGNFPLLRLQFLRLSLKLAAFSWIEAERTPFTNFGDADVMGGCSGNGALILRTPIPVAEGYYAEYKVPVRTVQDQEVWIAARIPKERRGDVTVRVAGQTLRLDGEPTGLYGDGFGWYRLGTTRLPPGLETVRLQIDGTHGGEAAIDVILITPENFRPNGVTMPDALNFAALPKKK